MKAVGRDPSTEGNLFPLMSEFRLAGRLSFPFDGDRQPAFPLLPLHIIKA